MPDPEPRRTEYVDLDTIRPAPRNAKRHTDLGPSFDEFGYMDSVIIDERTGLLIGGHGRTEKLAELRTAGADPPDGIRVEDGRWLIPVQRGWSSRDDRHAEAAGIALNRLTELGGWDDRLLVEMLSDFPDTSTMLNTVGFSPTDMASLLASVAAEDAAEGPRATDDVPPEPKVARTQPGDKWLLGNHVLVCGDSTDPDTYVALLGDERADMVWTDPPYGVDYEAMRGGEAAGRMAGDASPTTAEALLIEVLGLVGPVDAMFIACSWRSLSTVLAACSTVKIDPKACIVWDKGSRVQNLDRFAKQHEFVVYAGPFGGQPTLDVDVWSIPRDFDPDHPTPKPIELVARSLRAASEPGDVILDPFAGSGTTLMACEQEGRNARVVELSPTYCDVICLRYEAMTGTVAVHASTGESFLARVGEEVLDTKALRV